MAHRPPIQSSDAKTSSSASSTSRPSDCKRVVLTPKTKRTAGVSTTSNRSPCTSCRSSTRTRTEPPAPRVRVTRRARVSPDSTLRTDGSRLSVSARPTWKPGAPADKRTVARTVRASPSSKRPARSSPACSMVVKLRPHTGSPTSGSRWLNEHDPARLARPGRGSSTERAAAKDRRSVKGAERLGVSFGSISCLCGDEESVCADASGE